MSQWSILTDLPDDDAHLSEEFHKRYRNSWLILDVDGVKIVVSYNGLTDTGRHRFLNVESQGYELSNSTKHNLSVWFPEQGCYNLPEYGGIFVTQVPARQWKRAPSPETLVFEFVQNQMIHPFNMRLYVDIMSSTYYPNLQEALQKLIDSKWSGIALSKKYILGIHGKKHVIFSGNTPIGILTKKDIVPIIPEFTQDVLDFKKDGHGTA